MKIKSLFVILFLLIALMLNANQNTQAEPLLVTVDTLVDEADGTCEDGDCSLRDAIVAVPSGASISIPITGTIQLTLGELSIGKNMSILGPGSEYLTVSGESASRVFNIASQSSVTIRDLTIANGYAEDGNGGGIYSKGFLTLERCTIYNNNADKAGGGVYNQYYGTITVKQCSFINNHAQYGGGLKNASARAELWNSTFSGNVAEIRGGGVDNDKLSDAPVSAVEIKHCTFSENTNGGVTNPNSSTTALNTIVAGNLEYDCAGNFTSTSSFNLMSDYTCMPGFQTTITTLLRLSWQGWVYELLPTSVAIDRGTNTGCLKTDQLGTLRPQDGDGIGEAICDIGAFEALAPPPPDIRLFLPLVVRN